VVNTKQAIPVFFLPRGKEIKIRKRKWKWKINNILFFGGRRQKYREVGKNIDLRILAKASGPEPRRAGKVKEKSQEILGKKDSCG
jgi:hypothetical protein